MHGRRASQGVVHVRRDVGGEVEGDPGSQSEETFQEGFLEKHKHLLVARKALDSHAEALGLSLVGDGHGEGLHVLVASLSDGGLRSEDGLGADAELLQGHMIRASAVDPF